jgi:hypothetical protein
MTLPSERTSREIRAGRVTRRPPSFAVMLVALAIVFALAWMFFLRSGPAATAPVVRGIQGTYTWRAPGTSVGQTGTFSAVAGGNAGGEAKSTAVVLGGGPPAAAYDAAARTETMRVSHGPVVTEVRTVGAWPPVWRVATRSPLDYQGLAAVVRSAVEDGDETVGIKPLKDGDRTVWRAAMTVDGKQIDVVVDQETGIVTWCSDGKSTFTAEVDWDSPPPAGASYSVEVPAGTKVKTTDDDTHSYAPSAAAAGAAAGYDALVSDLAPDGYRLKAVATTRDDLRPLSWFSDTVISVPVASTGTAVLELYTRGLSQVTVEQVGPATMGLWAKVSGEEGEPAPDKLSYQESTLQYGALKGATASTWYQESGPSLYVSDARRAVFITGALTRQELIAFAEGLKPVPASASR